jgi:GNAT superfamily N-acetyltransferase
LVRSSHKDVLPSGEITCWKTTVSRSHVRVRVAALADLPGLVALERSTQEPGVRSVARYFNIDLGEELPDRLVALLSRADRTVLVAVDDDCDRLVGMVVACDDDAGVILPIPVLRASKLMVAPDQRRRGIGRALLAAVLHLAEERGIEHIVATSLPGSRDASRYLARLGFQPLTAARIASTAVLRRALGTADVPERVAMARRARIMRSARPGFVARSLTRGA